MFDPLPFRKQLSVNWARKVCFRWAESLACYVWRHEVDVHMTRMTQVVLSEKVAEYLPRRFSPALWKCALEVDVWITEIKEEERKFNLTMVEGLTGGHKFHFFYKTLKF